ncbi:hypothetical protein K504DRAFT_530706 [Pleomassaria siparia CBS 279.74]|uniref:Uncharacterized protein n=1 Tax=Pleomassaria siparia CBS 279.74 TaxID=1314801 RepID=A0A6G1KN72_9PLEO|nr:hypothetical protein K504DRAFT_530706 [Pleomassaria siparia CBS 279.74]
MANLRVPPKNTVAAYICKTTRNNNTTCGAQRSAQVVKEARATNPVPTAPKRGGRAPYQSAIPKLKVPASSKNIVYKTTFNNNTACGAQRSAQVVKEARATNPVPNAPKRGGCAPYQSAIPRLKVQTSSTSVTIPARPNRPYPKPWNQGRIANGVKAPALAILVASRQVKSVPTVGVKIRKVKPAPVEKTAAPRPWKEGKVTGGFKQPTLAKQIKSVHTAGTTGMRSERKPAPAVLEIKKALKTKVAVPGKPSTAPRPKERVKLQGGANRPTLVKKFTGATAAVVRKEKEAALDKKPTLLSAAKEKKEKRAAPGRKPAESRTPVRTLKTKQVTSPHTPPFLHIAPVILKKNRNRKLMAPVLPPLRSHEDIGYLDIDRFDYDNGIPQPESELVQMLSPPLRAMSLERQTPLSIPDIILTPPSRPTTRPTTPVLVPGGLARGNRTQLGLQVQFDRQATAHELLVAEPPVPSKHVVDERLRQEKDSQKARVGGDRNSVAELISPHCQKPVRMKSMFRVVKATGDSANTELRVTLSEPFLARYKAARRYREEVRRNEDPGYGRAVYANRCYGLSIDTQSRFIEADDIMMPFNHSGMPEGYWATQQFKSRCPFDAVDISDVFEAAPKPPFRPVAARKTASSKAKSSARRLSRSLFLRRKLAKENAGFNKMIH